MCLLLRMRTIPTERLHLLAKLIPTFAVRGNCMVSVAGPAPLNLDFLDQSFYYVIQVAPHLSSQG
jgi:hypothetical protein